MRQSSRFLYPISVIFAPKRHFIDLNKNLPRIKTMTQIGEFATLEGSRTGLAISTTAPSSIVATMIRSADAFCFDVDSTVIEEEGIDTLANFKGAGEKVANLTNR
jgi:hypothetical protein